MSRVKPDRRLDPIEQTMELALRLGDCEILAGILQSRRMPDQALAWAERGIELQKQMPAGRGASYKLADMRRKLLTELGQDSQALASAWSELEEYPSRLAYDQLMKYVPKGSGPRGTTRRSMPRLRQV